jgi:hypothetical protein
MRITYNFNKFHGGMSDDVREPSDVTFGVSKHFDIFSNPMRLTPYRSFENDSSDGATADGMKQYAVQNGFLGSDGKVYGLGKIVVSGYTKLFYKTSADATGWIELASGEGNAAVNYGSFGEYKSSLFGFQGTNQMWRKIIGGAINNSFGTTGATITSVSNGIIAADDCYYAAYNNVIVRVNAALSAMEDGVLTLPSNLKVTSICNYGLYLAIGCCEKNSTSTGQSMVYIWDLVQDDPQEALNWGEGALMVLGNVEGRLVGISDKYMSSASSLGSGSLVIKGWRGSDVQTMKEIIAVGDTTGLVKSYKVMKNNKLYFYAKVPTSASTYNEGIWVVGRRGVNYEFAITLDQVHETATSFEGIWSGGNFWFIAHSGDGSIARTDNNATFSNTSVYESQRLNGGDTSFWKKILGIAVSYSPLPTSGAVTAKYRVDAVNNTASWTTIFTDSTDGSMSHEAVSVEDLLGEYADGKEIQVRLESTGGAEITGLKVQLDTLQSQINE